MGLVWWLVRGKWSLRQWLGEIWDLVWVGAFTIGAMCLFVGTIAHKKDLEEGFRWMRGAAICLLLGGCALWLKFRGFV